MVKKKNVFFTDIAKQENENGVIMMIKEREKEIKREKERGGG